jgi:uncharacterized membrane protein
MTLVVLILTWLIGAVTKAIGDRTASALATVLSVLLQALVDLGAAALLLKAHDSVETVKIADLWHPTSYLKYLGALILSGAAIMLGFIALIVPGVILLILFMFVKYIVVDRALNPIEAMKESARITKGNRLNLFLLLLVVVAMNIVGAIALVVGLLVAVPVSSLAMVHAYRTLEHKASEVVVA